MEVGWVLPEGAWTIEITTLLPGAADATLSQGALLLIFYQATLLLVFPLSLAYSGGKEAFFRLIRARVIFDYQSEKDKSKSLFGLTSPKPNVVGEGQR